MINAVKRGGGVSREIGDFGKRKLLKKGKGGGVENW